MNDYDSPETLYDYEREEALAARMHDVGGEPGMWVAGSWQDRPSRREAEMDDEPQRGGIEY